MSSPLSHTTKLKIVVPVFYLIAAFVFFTLYTFLTGTRGSSIVGALITFLSSILWIIARIQLGDAPIENRLVTSGLYGEIRHPIYVFSTLAFAGIAVFVWIPLLFGVLIVLLLFQIVRSKHEEKVLATTMGRRYLRYKQRTLL